MSSVKGKRVADPQPKLAKLLKSTQQFPTSRGYREFHWVLLLLASGLARRDGLESLTFWKDLFPVGAVFPSCFSKPCWDRVFSP